MSLGLKAYHVAGEFSPRYEFNAKSGRWARVDRTADGTDVIKVDVTMDQPMFAWDIGTIEIGWINWQSGRAPNFVMVNYGEDMPARPDRAHKAGFRSKTWDGAQPPIVREFASTAGVTVAAIESLWDEITATPEAAAGQVPVLRAVNVLPITSPKGTNYAPVFNVLQWIDRDESVFGPRTVAAPGAAPIAAATPAPATPAPAGWPATTPATVAPTLAAWPAQALKAA
jgi:hypothetical protein